MIDGPAGLTTRGPFQVPLGRTLALPWLGPRPRGPVVRVGVIGAGAIGSVVGDALRDGGVEQALLSGVVAGRDSDPAAFEALLEGSDLVVEAASQAAVATYGQRVSGDTT